MLKFDCAWRTMIISFDGWLLWYVNMGEDLSEIVEYLDKYASFASITLWKDTNIPTLQIIIFYTQRMNSSRDYSSSVAESYFSVNFKSIYSYCSEFHIYSPKSFYIGSPFQPPRVMSFFLLLYFFTSGETLGKLLFSLSAIDDTPTKPFFTGVFGSWCSSELCSTGALLVLFS